MMNEATMVLYRDDVIALSRVNDQVYFDLDRVFEFREAVGMEFDANLLHFICTHLPALLDTPKGRELHERVD
jgi:hypothetical protein